MINVAGHCFCNAVEIPLWSFPSKVEPPAPFLQGSSATESQTMPILVKLNAPINAVAGEILGQQLSLTQRRVKKIKRNNSVRNRDLSVLSVMLCSPVSRVKS